LRSSPKLYYQWTHLPHAFFIKSWQCKHILPCCRDTVLIDHDSQPYNSNSLCRRELGVPLGREISDCREDLSFLHQPVRRSLSFKKWQSNLQRSTTAQVFGTITDIATSCYPIEPPYPLGYGTLCQTPAGQLSGDFTRDTLFPVSNSSSASSSPTSTGTGAASSSTTSATSTSTSSSNSSTTVRNATIAITIDSCSLT
jgi:hypothetical protein